MGNIFSELSGNNSKNNYDWTPDLPDFRDDIYKYPKMNVSRIENSSDLRHMFKEYTGNYGSSTANAIASVLDAYNLDYNYDQNSVESQTSIRNCIKKFKIANDKKISYYKLNNFKNQLCQSLNDGFPILFGFTVYESFEKEEVAKTGKIPVPQKNERILGGICLVIVGYNGREDTWIVRSPFTKSFGDNGYIYISAEILTKNNNISADFWSISYE